MILPSVFIAVGPRDGQKVAEQGRLDGTGGEERATLDLEVVSLSSH